MQICWDFSSKQTLIVKLLIFSINGSCFLNIIQYMSNYALVFCTNLSVIRFCLKKILRIEKNSTRAKVLIILLSIFFR